jgi:hypothetical protein
LARHEEKTVWKLASLFVEGQQNGLRLGDNNLPSAAASLAADTFFTESRATARRTLLGLGNWQVNFWNQGEEYTSENPQCKQNLK